MKKESGVDSTLNGVKLYKKYQIAKFVPFSNNLETTPIIPNPKLVHVSLNS